MNLEQRALEFATKAHTGQVRRYTGEPYITHPIAVAETVRRAGGTTEMIAAAYLHDVVEDCGITIDDIFELFGATVADYVWYLTDSGTGNRAQRKAADRHRIARAVRAVHTIKLADIIHNTSSIAAHDPEFWKVYREEKRLLLGALTKGDETLMALAMELVR